MCARDDADSGRSVLLSVAEKQNISKSEGQIHALEKGQLLKRDDEDI